MLSPLDILAVLKLTIMAIRSVRNYLIVLPEDHDYSPPPPNTLLSPSLSPRNKPVPPLRQTGDTPLNLIRQIALEVLGVLRGIEEKYRLPMTEETSDVLSDHGSGSTRSRVPSPGSDDSESGTSFAFSVVKPKGTDREILVYSDDEDDINKEEPEKRETWDEKLVLGGGWLYRQNVTLLDLEKEREAVALYLETLDKLIFGGETPLHQRGWAFALQRLRARQRRSSNAEGLSPNPGEIRAGHVRGNRVISNGLLDAMKAMAVSEESEPQLSSAMSHDPWDEDHLPDWAKATCFVDDILGEYPCYPAATTPLLTPFTGRALVVLHHLLPPELSKHLPPVDLPPDREALLLALSSGQLLCVAYNTGVRRSKKPWGYINKAAIHDIAALEAEALAKPVQEEANGKKRTWTFRRIENLRLWAACVLITSSPVNDSPSNLQRSQIAVHAPARLKLPAQWYTLTTKQPSSFTVSGHHRFSSSGAAFAVRRPHRRKARGKLGGHA